MTKDRLFLSDRHGPFRRELKLVAGGKSHAGVRVPVLGRKTMRINKGKLTQTLNRLANSKTFLEEITPETVPPLLRRLAANGNGPREYFVDGSLVERTFGATFPTFEGGHGYPPLTWETGQPHRLPREFITGKRLPLPAPRDLTSWQASVVVFCWAQRVATLLNLTPCEVYFFHRDWLVDQVKVSKIDNELRLFASRLLGWMSGSSDEEFDACVASVPVRPIERVAKRVSCGIVTAETCYDHPRLHPIQPPTRDHGARATGWTSNPDMPHSILKFTRSRVQPMRLWEAIREIARVDEGRMYNIIFDARHVYLYIAHELWRRIALERIPLLLAQGSDRLRIWGTRARPVAPFFAAAYASERASSVELAVRGFFALLFHRAPPVDAHLIELVPSILNRYPDVVARMRAAYREELTPTRGFRRNGAGFFASLYAMTLSNAHRAITFEGCKKLEERTVRHKLEEQFTEGSNDESLSPMVLLSKGEVFHLYSTVAPHAFEHLVALTPGWIRPAKRVELDLTPSSPRESAHGAQRRHAQEEEESREPDSFVRALYEAEHLATLSVSNRKNPHDSDPEIELDQRALWDRELAPGTTAKCAFLATVDTRSPTGPNDTFYSAHEDAEPCLRIHPVTHARVEARYECHDDMETVDLRSPRLDSPISLGLEASLDDRSDGRTKHYSEGWKAVVHGNAQLFDK